MIAEFEDHDDPYTEVPFRVYGMKLEHKHVPEITKWSGLSERPLRCQASGGIARNDQSALFTMGVATKADTEGPSRDFEKHWDGCRYVTVESVEDVDNIALLMPEELNDTNELRLYARERRTRTAVLVGLLDNLAATGQAVQNMNIMLGLP